MRVWTDVYDEDSVKLGGGPVTAIQSASITEQLDGAGTFNLDLATDEKVLTQLVNEAEVRIQVQTADGEQGREWCRGIIRDNEIQDEEGGTSIRVTGPDTLDVLTERTVGIGRSYENQTMQTIINGLVALVPGWSATVESAIASDLQTARFDGANVLRALIRVAEEKGIHFRNGTTPNTLEFGAFGERATASDGRTVRAIKPPSTVTQEIADNEAIILIDRISRSSKSDAVVNWCIPIGAGEGSAALTLRDTTYAIYNEDGTLYRAGTASRYPIYRRVNANGIIEYYMDASGGKRQRQAVVTFKEIGSVSNSTQGKQYVANALANAAMAYLDRAKLPLVTYKLSAKNVRAIIRPGHKLPVDYQGRIEVLDETRSRTPRLTYLSVNEDYWVMKVTTKISDSQITHDFEVATVDRYEMDSTRIVVSLMEAMQAKNVSVQTFPIYWENTYTDSISDADGKTAKFRLNVNEYVTDIIRVGLRLRTFPLWAATMAHIGFPSEIFYETWQLRLGYNYPSGLTITIDGIDRTSALGGPWSVATNAAVDMELDISTYIVEASGGIYQPHSVIINCANRFGEIGVSPYSGYPDSWASSGIVEANFKVIAMARAIVPELTS